MEDARSARGAVGTSTPSVLSPFISERMKWKLLAALFAIGAFYTLPLAVIAVIALVMAAFGKGPDFEVLDVVKLVPLVFTGVGCTIAFYAFRKKEREAKADAEIDADRRQEALFRAGDANALARRIAGIDVSSPVASTPLARAPNERSRPPTTSGMTIERAASRVRCTWCGRFVSVAQGDDESGDATCASCGHTFSMREELLRNLGMRKKPLGLDASEFGNTCTITHPTGTSFSYLYPIIAFGFVLISVPGTLQNPALEQRALLGGIGLFGVVLTIVTAMMKSRHTVYTISQTTLIVAIHGAFGRELAHFDAADIDQVFVRSRTRTRRVRERVGFSDRYRRRKVTVTTYDVVVHDVARKETVLARDLAHADHALYIEQEIENRLGIVDRKMGSGPSR